MDCNLAPCLLGISLVIKLCEATINVSSVTSSLAAAKMCISLIEMPSSRSLFKCVLHMT